MTPHPVMATTPSRVVFDRPALRGRTHVFRDRPHAGQALAELVTDHGGVAAVVLVLAIPAGGVPVAAALASALRLPVDVLVVSKITPPWDTEIGYGALAADGTLALNDPLVRRLGLSSSEVEQGIEVTRAKVARRARTLRGDRPPPALSGTAALLVDDGLASGFTMRVAVTAARRAGAHRVLVGAPTGHDAAVRWLAEQCDGVYCPNIRAGYSFAVADAYERWSDVTDEEVASLLGPFGSSGVG